MRSTDLVQVGLAKVLRLLGLVNTQIGRCAPSFAFHSFAALFPLFFCLFCLQPSRKIIIHMFSPDVPRVFRQ